jgi:hypothetical protein
MSEVTPAQATPKAGETTGPVQQSLPLDGAAAPNNTAEAKPTDNGATLLTETEKAPASVPEKYELKLPENALLDQKALEKIADIAKQQGFSNEQAQKVLEEQNAAVSEYVKAQVDAFRERQQSWKQTIETDKEMGGSNFKQTAEFARRVVDRYGSQELKATLNESGLGDHPELVRFVARIGKEMSDHQFFNAGTAPAEKKSPAEVLYGEQR